MICKYELFRIKHDTFLEGKTFLRNKHKIDFFFNKMHIFFFCKKENTINVISDHNVLLLLIFLSEFSNN